MKKYRIVKKETFNQSGKVIETSYYIQKRFLFFWIYALIDKTDWSRYKCGVCLIRRRYEFDSYDIAMSFLDKFIINRFVERYQGCTIIRVPIPASWENQELCLYVNLSHSSSWADDVWFDCNVTLSDLKRKIPIKTTSKITAIWA